MRFSIAMFWARITFFEVIGKNAPALTVASLAMIITMRVSIRAIPVITPAAGRAAPFFVHAMGCIETQFKESAGIGEERDALACRQSPLGMLVFNGLGTSTFANLFAFIAYLRHEVS